MADVVCIASWNADLVSRVPRPVARGETLMARTFEISPGGKGSNAAVAAARQGATVALLARIGDDDFGRMGLDLWRPEGIATRHVEQAAGERGGVAQIQVFDDGDNSIAVFRGAGAGLGAAHARAASALLRACRVVMASCEVPLECTTEAFRIAPSGGALTLLNPAPAQPLPDAMLALVDVLTPNESELLALAGVSAGATPNAAAQALLARGARAVLVTLGAAGCRLYQRNGAPPLEEPGRRIDVADTIGAGDTFTGALAAALSVRGRGAIAGMPTFSEVATLLT